LAERDPGVWSAAEKEAFLARADWHRHHADDPTYRPEILTTQAWAPMMWDRWAGWGPDDPRWRVEIIDTTGLTVAESADRVRAWIETVRNPPRDG
jgi:broad specificity phosphatase PhoE